MLSQIVRPMVNTQIRLLVKSKATKAALVGTISKWLGYLGVEAQVTQINTAQNKIQVSITVAQPEDSNDGDWQKILDNIDRDSSEIETTAKAELDLIPTELQTKYQSILAYAIQMSSFDYPTDWLEISQQLQKLGLEESVILGVKSALKVPQYLDSLVKDLDADVAAIALSQAVSIALIDRQVNSGEYQGLQTLLDAVAENCH